MVILILILIGFGYQYNHELTICETRQSPFCYTIFCPCDNPEGEPKQPPCFGYAKMPAGDNQWYCSNAPNTLVDNNGNII